MSRKSKSTYAVQQGSFITRWELNRISNVVKSKSGRNETLHRDCTARRNRSWHCINLTH